MLVRRMLSVSLCVIGLLTILSGCTGENQQENPAVNSGVVDEEYVGDPNPKLVNEYLQTDEEAKVQEEIVEAIKEGELLFEGGGLSGH